MKLKEIIAFIEKLAPLETQAESDNSGLQLDCGKTEISRVLLALEITRGVVDEAVAEKADMIITHHPMFFHPLKNIIYDTPEGYCLGTLIKNDITVYSSHTPFDKAKGGNNEYFLKKLQCRKNKAISDFVYMGELDKAINLKELAERVAELAETPGMVSVSGDGDREVKKIAVCTGAGGELIHEAMEAGADVYISGEFRHHEAQGARERFFPIIAAGHWGSEMQFVDNMEEQLSKKFKGELTLIKSKVDQNPFDFVV